MSDQKELYDCIIVGGGPAGLGGAVYTSRDGLKTLIVEKFMPGGQINTTDRIENYPGIERIDGPGLIERMQKQAEGFGAEVKIGSEVMSLSKQDDGNIAVSCESGDYIGRSVILCPGSDYRKLGVPGEEEFRNAGAGVSYCGTCDAPFFRGREVVSVGGGNTAIEESLHLAKFASKVTVVHRRDEFRATKILADELIDKSKEQGSNIVIRYDSVVTAIEGAGKVETAVIKNVKTGVEESYGCDGVFVFIGMVPNTGFLDGFLDLTDNGFIKCDPCCLRTGVPGVFVAGDCRVGASMQLITAVSDGVVAAMMLKHYFRDTGWWNEPMGDVLEPGGW